MSHETIRPGHQGMAGDRGFGCVNGRQAGTKVFGGYLFDGPWGVRVGTRQYPDYIFGSGGFTGGHWLTPDDADELAEHLRHCAAWARAQTILDGSAHESAHGDHDPQE